MLDAKPTMAAVRSRSRLDGIFVLIDVRLYNINNTKHLSILSFYYSLVFGSRHLMLLTIYLLIVLI